MKNKRFQLLFFAFALLQQGGLACSTGAMNSIPSEPRAPISLDRAEMAKPGITTRGAALALYGAPDLKPEVEGLKGKDIWIYLNGASKSTRFSLIFSENTNLLETANWFVNASDPESDFDRVKAHYPGSHMEVGQPQWRNPHAVSDEVFYVDRKNGLKVVFGKAAGKVEAISWSAPTDPAVANN